MLPEGLLTFLSGGFYYACRIDNGAYTSGTLRRQAWCRRTRLFADDILDMKLAAPPQILLLRLLVKEIMQEVCCP